MVVDLIIIRSHKSTIYISHVWLKMISCCLFVMFLATVTAQNLSVDCSSDRVTVSWKPRLDLWERMDVSRALLGNCPASFLGFDEKLHFYVLLHDCGFHKQVSVNRVTYSNMLIYDRGPGLPFIAQSLQCVYHLPLDKVSPGEDDQTGAEDDQTGAEDNQTGADDEVVFSMELMNSDFSGPAPSVTFILGSSIPIRAEVHHSSLRIFLDRCVAATDSDISRASRVHPIISNSGCLMESKERNSTFLPRLMPAELRLYLEAFQFALGENIFLHCDLTAQDIHSLNDDGKACQYVKERRRWELLDDSLQSHVCSCCEFTCLRRTDILTGVSARMILGPFIIVENKSERNASLNAQTDEDLTGLSESPVWLLVVSVTALLVIVMSVLAVSYYLCVWRGGRMGYRPSRDLLVKY